MIDLYDSENIDTLPEPKTKESLSIRDFFYPLIKGKSTDYIANVDTQVALLAIDDLLLPLSINNEEYENAYVSSLYSHYISYSIEEMYLLKQPLLEKGLTALIKGAGKLLKHNKINKVIYVNNWLLSTNLQVNLTAKQIKEIADYLIVKYPDHMIVFRSLSDYLHGDLMNRFKENGFKELASRQVYISKPLNQLAKHELNFIKQDSKELNKKNYTLSNSIEPNPENLKKIQDLYNQLYIDKYSAYNPAFTTHFIKHCLNSDLFEFFTVSKEDEMLGCLGYWKLNGVMTTPILGYRVDLGNKSGLYRILCNLIFEESQKKNLIAHRSSGASEFKINRGAIASVEYSMIYNQHLPLKRRASVGILRFLCNEIGVKMLKDKKL